MATSTGPPTGGGAANVAPTFMPPAKIRPGRVWYWVALAVLLAGVAWAVVASVLLFGQVGSFPRVPDPGTGRHQPDAQRRLCDLLRRTGGLERKRARR
jgi:hypothetical protein